MKKIIFARKKKKEKKFATEDTESTEDWKGDFNKVEGFIKMGSFKRKEILTTKYAESR